MAGAPIAGMMRAAVLSAPGRVELRDRPIPTPGTGEALLAVRTTSICDGDLQVVRGVPPVDAGRILGHEVVGSVAALGPGVEGYAIGERVITGDLAPCGDCASCRGGDPARCVGRSSEGWTLGTRRDGCQAEYVCVPDALLNLARVPDSLTDEQALLCIDTMNSGFAAAESGDIRIGDSVAIFGQGPAGLCATAAAKLRGATQIIAVDGVAQRLAVARRLGADVVLNDRLVDPGAEILALTGARGVDVAIEALGSQEAFEHCLRVLRPGGVLSMLDGGWRADQPDEPRSGPLDRRVVRAGSPGGQERMRRLLNVAVSGRVDLRPLITHRFALDEIELAYDVFGNHLDGVLKVAIRSLTDTHQPRQPEPLQLHLDRTSGIPQHPIGGIDRTGR